ncbi:alpha/beta fold hydrolase [Mycolicibacterium sediminis]|nr:alpha/beta fold hydrolase [Mycolicibacterium sediminis]
MHFTTTGTGKPLLLVHGISNLHNWDLVVPGLARERTVYAVDLPGFGDSPPLDGEVSVATLTDAVEKFVSEQGLDGVDVVGSSMGARMVLEMARRGHRGNVVALDPGGFWTDAQVRVFGATVAPSIALVKRIQPLLPALTRSRVGRTALLLQFSAKPWRLPADLVLTELRGFARSASIDDAVHALIHGPKQQGAKGGSTLAKVTIGWGRNDRVTFPSEAERARALYPQASMHWFDDCGHFPHWDQPEQTVSLILDATADQPERGPTRVP